LVVKNAKKKEKACAKGKAENSRVERRRSCSAKKKEKACAEEKAEKPTASAEKWRNLRCIRQANAQ
jgi:hypothetical protein